MTSQSAFAFSYILVITWFSLPCITNATENSSFVDYVLSEHKNACKSYRLCSFNGTKKRNDRCSLCAQCRCDDDCMRYNDCCADKYLKLLSTNKKPKRKIKYTCQSDAFKLVLFQKPVILFFSIAQCYSYHDPLLLSLCERPDKRDPYLNTPVTSQVSGEVYRNKFCAQCNGESEYKLWTIRVNCSVSLTVSSKLSGGEVLDYFIKHPQCFISYSPPKFTQLRRCYAESKTIITTCNKTGLWPVYNHTIYKACGTYTNPVLFMSNIFKNVFCFYCNSENYFPPSVICRFETPYPFSVLIDPRAAQKIITKTRETCKCKDNEVFDKFKKICRQMVCSFGRRLEGKQCISSYFSASSFPYSFEVTLRPADDMFANSDIQANGWISSLLSNITATFKEKMRGYKLQVHRSVLSLVATKSDRPTRVLRLIFLVKFVLLSATNLDVVEKLLIDIRYSRWLIPFKNSKTEILSSASMTLVDSVHTEPQFRVTVNKNYLLITYAKQTEHVVNGFAVLEPHNYTMITGLLFCPLVQINLNETRNYSRQDHTLMLVADNIILNSEEFLISDDGTVSICQQIVTGIKTCPSLPPGAIFTKNYLIVSITCQGISLICLFLTLIVFFVFPSMRTLPGKITIGLIFTLFMSVGLHLFGIARIENAVMCKVIALLTHFFLTSSFTWMGISSFHMYRVFKDILATKTSKSCEKKTFRIYLLISLLIPTGINVSVIGINYAVNGPRDIGYGKGLCYVSNIYSVVMAVLVPVTIVVLFNCVLFILTIVSLRKMSRERRNLTGKKENIYLYIKLGTLTGLNWLFAFIAPLSGIQALWYVFTVLCGLQGLYIFIAFVCNKRVLRLFKEKYQKLGKQPVTGSTKTTSTTGSKRSPSVSEINRSRNIPENNRSPNASEISISPKIFENNRSPNVFEISSSTNVFEADGTANQFEELKIKNFCTSEKYMQTTDL